MKKALSLAMCLLMLLSVAAVGVSAIDYDQPFDTGTLDSERFRIPALLTLNDGSVIAGADIRYGHGSDSPNNIDIAVAISEDGYTGWDYTVVNYFDDYADGVTSTDSASFIDSTIVQSSTGRIFVLCDAYPSGGGYLQSKKGTGYIEIGGKKYMLLTTGNNDDSLDSFGYYIGDYAGNFAPVLTRAGGKLTEYAVDREFRLYKNGAPIYVDQKGAEGVKVQQNVFYSASDLKCYRTTYLWLRYSDDNGKTWSAPTIISDQVKKESESFLGVGPGRGIAVNYNGKERLIYCVYDNDSLIHDPIVENASTIYSDDNGVTWHRGGETDVLMGIGKTSEAQIIAFPGEENPTLRMYARNSSNYIAYADSTDGGVTWTTFTADTALEGTANCMVSFINTSRVVEGKSMVLSSAGSNLSSRADGVIRVGLAGNGSIKWTDTYPLAKGFFAYSCLTELSDGNFAILYEDEAAHLKYMVFSVSDDGTISEVNGENPEIIENLTIWQKIERFFKQFFAKLLIFFGLV